MKYKYEYNDCEYEYEYEYIACEYEYEFEYNKFVLELYSSMSTSTEYYISANYIVDCQIYVRPCRNGTCLPDKHPQR